MSEAPAPVEDAPESVNVAAAVAAAVTVTTTAAPPPPPSDASAIVIVSLSAYPVPPDTRVIVGSPLAATTTVKSAPVPDDEPAALVTVYVPAVLDPSAPPLSLNVATAPAGAYVVTLATVPGVIVEVISAPNVSSACVSDAFASGPQMFTKCSVFQRVLP